MQSSRLPACCAHCRFSKPLCLMIVKLWRLNVIHLGITKSESGMQLYSRSIAVWRSLAMLHFNWFISETGAWQLSNCETESPPEFLTMSELQPHIRLCSVLKARKLQSLQLSYSVTHGYYWGDDRIYYYLGSRKVANRGFVRPDCTTRHPRATVSPQLVHKIFQPDIQW